MKMILLGGFGALGSTEQIGLHAYRIAVKTPNELNGPFRQKP